MGYQVYRPEDFPGLVAKVEKTCKTVLKASGACKMCETPFSITMESDNPDGYLDQMYECPCGYFRYHPDLNEVIEDDHNVPKRIWLERLEENLAKKAATTGQLTLSFA